jgi:hypothetical protein
MPSSSRHFDRRLHKISFERAQMIRRMYGKADPLYRKCLLIAWTARLERRRYVR